MSKSKQNEPALRTELRHMPFIERQSYLFAALEPCARPRLHVVRLAHEYWDSGFLVYNHRFRDYTLMYCVTGGGLYRTQQHHWSIRPGTALMYGPAAFRELRCGPDQTMEFYIATFAGPDAESMVAEHCGAEHWALPLAKPQHVGRAMEQMFLLARDEAPSRERLCALYLPVLLTLIRDEMHAAQGASTGSASSFFRCKQYIDRHFECLSSVYAVSEATHISHAYMCRLFKAHLGLTPHEYLLRLKMNQAAQWLATSEQSVESIAENLGFSDRFSFSKAFKRILRLPPGHFRH